MRQITKRAFQAFKCNADFKLSNTEVRASNKQTLLLLFGNVIARKCRQSGIVEITTAGWDTPTTKERLKPFAGVHTIQYELHLEGLPWTGDWTVIHTPE